MNITQKTNPAVEGIGPAGNTFVETPPRCLEMMFELADDFPLTEEEFEERIKNAERYLFIFGAGDVSEDVGRVNSTLWVAKLHYLQEMLGYRPRALVIGAPDFSFQTTPHKFQYAVPEGAKVVWGDGSYDFVPAEMEFDFCGTLIGEAMEWDTLGDVLERIQRMKRREYEIDGTRIQLVNFSPGSHFLNVYEVQNHEELGLPRKVAILHTASDEKRDPIKEFVKAHSERVETPFGDSLVLRGKPTDEYVERCEEASRFARKKRQLLFEEILRNDRVIANHNHYELISPNCGIIGCYNAREGKLFPATLDTNKPAYILSGRRTLSEQALQGLDIEGADEWVKEELQDAALLPHGGGHKLLGVEQLTKVVLYDGRKVFIFDGSRAYESLMFAPRGYRSDGVIERARSLGLAGVYATLSFAGGIKVDF